MCILSDVSCKKGFPKWDGLIDLKEAGLRVPHAVFFAPNTKENEINEFVTSFLRELKPELLALRPDGGNGVGKTPPGINLESNEVSKIVQKISEWSFRRFGVVLLDTHNRFDYDFCCNCLLDDDGSFHIEFVGPGFDGGDLNKAILLPTTIVDSKPTTSVFDYIDPISGEANLDSLEHLIYRVTIESRCPTDREIDVRLKYIASQLLPDMGVAVETTKEGAKNWLIKTGYTKLFDSDRSRNYVSADDLQELVLAASRYANKLKQSEQKLKGQTLTAHKYASKIVFFGTFNGRKWGK